jgi:hypothetical protein
MMKKFIFHRLTNIRQSITCQCGAERKTTALLISEKVNTSCSMFASMRFLESRLACMDFQSVNPTRRRRLPERLVGAVALLLFIQSGPASTAEIQPMWDHIICASDFSDLRNTKVEWFVEQGGRLDITVTRSDSPSYAWVTLGQPPGGWDLSRRAAVEAVVTNEGNDPAEVQLWVVADRGWEPVSDVTILEPADSRRMICDLRQKFKDGTPKLNPSKITSVRILLKGKSVKEGTKIVVSRLVASGEAPPWHPPANRLELPPIEEGPPGAGKRVRYRPAHDTSTNIHSALYLPEDWEPGGTYPVIVEYPGNIFFVRGCYSPGLPEQCAIGYGMSEGKGAIWISLPFIDRQKDAITEGGWGNPDDTAEYCMEVLQDVCTKFGGDRDNLVLTGFSRGAIACGYIGLRNEKIARLWKGLHLCQHYDGDGWNGATMDDAMERARRFRGKAVFNTDNPEKAMQPLIEAMGAPAIFVKSGLGAHSTAMFLDDRESTKKLRQWFRDLTTNIPASADGEN